MLTEDEIQSDRADAVIIRILMECDTEENGLPKLTLRHKAELRRVAADEGWHTKPSGHVIKNNTVVHGWNRWILHRSCMILGRCAAPVAEFVRAALIDYNKLKRDFDNISVLWRGAESRAAKYEEELKKALIRLRTLERLMQQLNLERLMARDKGELNGEKALQILKAHQDRVFVALGVEVKEGNS